MAPSTRPVSSLRRLVLVLVLLREQQPREAVEDQADAAGDREHAEDDPEDHRVQVEVPAEAAAHARRAPCRGLLRRRGGRGSAASGPGSPAVRRRARSVVLRSWVHGDGPRRRRGTRADPGATLISPRIRSRGADPDAAAAAAHVTIGDMPVATPRPAAPRTQPTAPDEPPLRKLYRSADGRMLGGVARGLAGHLGLPVIWVRLVFLGLFLARRPRRAAVRGVLDLRPARRRRRAPRPRSVVSETSPDGRRRLRKPDKGQIVALIALCSSAPWHLRRQRRPRRRAGRTSGRPLLVGAGVVLVWRQADNARRARWTEVGRRRRTAPGSPGPLAGVAAGRRGPHRLHRRAGLGRPARHVLHRRPRRPRRRSPCSPGPGWSG